MGGGMSAESVYPVLDTIRTLKQQALGHRFPEVVYMDKPSYRRLVRELHRYCKEVLHRKPPARVEAIYGMTVKIHKLGLPLVFVDERQGCAEKKGV
jgi:hypothetical protein